MWQNIFVNFYSYLKYLLQKIKAGALNKVSKQFLIGSTSFELWPKYFSYSFRMGFWKNNFDKRYSMRFSLVFLHISNTFYSFIWNLISRRLN